MQAPFVSKPLVHISSVSLEGVGAALSAGANDAFFSPQSVAWFAANKALYVPIIVTRPILITNMWVCNGSSTVGNVDIGLYTKDGTLIVASGATAQSGTLNAQTFNITDTLIGTGDFYLGLSFSSASGTVAASPTVVALFLVMCGVQEQASAHPLPANATFAASTITYVPYFGLTGRAFV